MGLMVQLGFASRTKHILAQPRGLCLDNRSNIERRAKLTERQIRRSVSFYCSEAIYAFKFYGIVTVMTSPESQPAPERIPASLSFKLDERRQMLMEFFKVSNLSEEAKTQALAQFELDVLIDDAVDAYMDAIVAAVNDETNPLG